MYGKTLMQVQSSRFGPFEVDPDRALTFQRALLGFPDSSRFVIVEMEDSPYLWLQSVEEEDVAFLATSPFVFFPDYNLVLSDEDQAALEVEDPDDVQILTLLTIHRSGDRADDPAEAITANLLGPIVVNTETGRAVQLVLDNPDYSTREALVA